MTIKKYAGDKITGLASDTKPTNVTDGATFYELDTGKIYRRYSSAWTEIATQGTTGTQGVQGIQGRQGIQGANGFQGIQGTQGTLGLQGIQGVDGGMLTAGSYVVKAVKNGTTQNVLNGADTVVTLVDDFDPNGWWTSNKFQPTIAGYYSMSTQIWLGAGTINNNQTNLQLRKNGNTQIAIAQTPVNNSTVGEFLSISTIAYFNGTTDYVEVTFYTANPTSQDINGSANGTWFTAALYAYGAQGVQGTIGLQGNTGFQGLQGTQGRQGIQGTDGSQGIQGRQGIQGANGFQGIQGTTGLQGNTGTQGTTGLQGNTGTQGTTGLQGNTGFQGLQGTTGTQGANGFQGLQGNTGTQGLQGTIGLQGNTGFQGIQGRQGTDGSQGIQGRQGIQGNTGTQGTTGLQGNTGFQGTTGLQGANGFQGLQGTLGLQGTTGTQGANGIQGLQGTTGLQGNTGFQGTTGTQGANGTQGLQGTTGLQGNTGTQGLQGTQGRQGTDGSQGIQGRQGIQGNTGFQGLQGTTGLQGNTGTQGTTGTQGLQGNTGFQGTTGTQGANGTQGLQGITGTGLQGANGFQGITGTSIQGATGPSTLINATAVTVNDIVFPVFVTDPGTNQTAQTSPGLTYNPSSNTLNLAGSITIGGNISFDSISSTRIWEPTANVLAFVTSDSEDMRIDASGNVGIGTTSPIYKLHVNGAFAANTKSFVIDHPTKSDMKLRYGSLEGPENGVYVRGRVQGPYIYLPDYWTGLVDKDSITVSLTPIAKTEMPSVLSYNNEKIVLHSDSPIDCFYHIFGERKDVDKLIVEY